MPPRGRAPPRPRRSARPGARWLTRRGTLGRSIERIERLARRHEQAIALRPTKAHVAANLRDANAAQKLALRVPHRDAAVADGSAGIARTPQVAVDISADTIGAAFDAINHEVAEQPAIGELVVAADVEGVHLALAARARVPRALAGTHDIELFIVVREAQAVGIGHLLLGDHEVDAPAGIDAVAVGRQLAFGLADFRGLTEAVLETPLRVARTAEIGRASCRERVEG